MELRAQVLLLSSLILAIVCSFSAITFLSYQDMRQIQLGVETSYSVTDQSLIYQGRRNNELKDTLTAQATELQPEFRQKAVLDFVQNPSNGNFQHLIKTESEYRRHAAGQMAYLEKRMTYYGAITIAACVILGFGLLAFVVRFIFRPLNDLSTKMVDFLNNKYSYQFTVPADHEIGKLHATFNAMAQKVLLQIEGLKSLDKAKTEFLSIASHELRTPLTSIRGSLGLLEGGVVGPMNDAAKNLMHIALNETDRLIRIINELLDLAKIEARQFPLKKSWISAEHLSTQTLAGIKGFSDAAFVKIALGEFTDVEIHVDADRIQQVLTNLLSNAIKFSPKNSTVLLHFRKQEEGFVFEVQDSGQGISPEDQELIFEKFRQATSQSNPLVKGTGLGLAIAKALVEQHGGQIGVRSRPGEGSTFYFTVTEFRVLKAQPAAEAS